MTQPICKTQHVKGQPISISHRIKAIQARADEFGMALALSKHFYNNSPTIQHIELDIAVLTIVEESVLK